jgi:predicted nucleotidyltransferase
MLTETVNQMRGEIAALCRTYRVRALWVFGSAVTDAFAPETSDIDFLVDLGVYDENVARQYIGLANGLEALLGSDVDLVSVGGLNKPRFREEVERTRLLIYEANHDQAVA